MKQHPEKRGRKCVRWLCLSDAHTYFVPLSLSCWKHAGFDILLSTARDGHRELFSMSSPYLRVLRCRPRCGILKGLEGTRKMQASCEHATMS